MLTFRAEVRHLGWQGFGAWCDSGMTWSSPYGANLFVKSQLALGYPARVVDEETGAEPAESAVEDLKQWYLKEAYAESLRKEVEVKATDYPASRLCSEGHWHTVR